MKAKKSYLKKKYSLENTKVLLYFPNNFCLKSEQTRKFQRLCLTKGAKAMFLPSSFGISASPESQGPSIIGVFAQNLGFAEIALSENLKQISSYTNKKQNFSYELKKDKHEHTKKYAQSFLFLLELQNKRVM